MPVNNKIKEDWVRFTFVGYEVPDIPCHPEMIGHLIKETPDMFLIDMIYVETADAPSIEDIPGFRVDYDQKMLFIVKRHVLFVEPLPAEEVEDEGFHPYTEEEGEY